MTDMRRARLMQGANGDHTLSTLRVRVAHCPPPPVARKLSYPSWKVIVSASRGQYLKPGSIEPGFFLQRMRQAKPSRMSDHTERPCRAKNAHAIKKRAVFRALF